MGFVITGKVERVRESKNPNTGEVTMYVEVGDYGLLQEVAAAPAQVVGVTAGANIQVPVSVRASAYNGQPRMTVRALDAFRVASAQGSR